MSIHQTIYDTLALDADDVCSMLGFGEVKTVEVRRASIKSFLEENEWNEEKFVAWLPSWNISQTKAESTERDSPPLPSAVHMAINVFQATAQAVGSGLKQVSEEEQERRHNMCKEPCEFYRTEDDRCSQCGCWTTYKSSLEAWHCPLVTKRQEALVKSGVNKKEALHQAVKETGKW